MAIKSGVKKAGRRAGDKDIKIVKEAYLEGIKRVGDELREDDDLKALNKYAGRQLMEVSFPDDFEDFLDLQLTPKQMDQLLEGTETADKLNRYIEVLKGIFQKIILKMSDTKADKICLDSSEYMDFYYQDMECGIRLYTYWFNGVTIKLIEKKQYKKFCEYINHLSI
jgi:hypothetical protein